MADIDRFLKFIAEKGASDLHLSTGRPAIMRLDGALVPLTGGNLTAEQSERFLTEIMPETSRADLRQRGDTDFAYELPGAARFRINVFRDRCGLGAAIRRIPSQVMPIDQLGLPDAAKDLCYLPKGLVLVTGPTGCGKSTTLASMIDLINTTRKVHIVTVEDPIEYVHEDKGSRINQRELHSHVETFARALRAGLRQDPNVVLLGEMRDLETTRIAIETAETGHLVFATLHTTTAASTVDRLINQYPPNEQEQIRAMLADTLRGVIAQVLLKAKPSGVVAAFEVLISNTAVQVCIRERKIPQIQSIMQTGAKLGMRTLNESLLRLVLSGRVDAREALAHTVDRDDLMQKFTVAGVEI